MIAPGSAGDLDRRSRECRTAATTHGDFQRLMTRRCSAAGRPTAHGDRRALGVRGGRPTHRKWRKRNGSEINRNRRRSMHAPGCRGCGVMSSAHQSHLATPNQFRIRRRRGLSAARPPFPVRLYTWTDYVLISRDTRRLTGAGISARCKNSWSIVTRKCRRR